MSPDIKTDDYVSYDGSLGRVVSVYPSSSHNGFDADVYWLSTNRETTVWVSDLELESDGGLETL